MIHLFGDSHIDTLAQARPDIFVKHGVISFSAYKAGNIIAFDSDIQNHLSTIPKNSKVLVSFGEIDCRRHIMKFVKRLDKPIKDVVAINIGGLRKVFIYLQKKHKLAAFAPYPSLLSPHIPSDTPELYEGTWGDVLEVKAEFNDQMKILCDEMGVFFLSVFKEYREGRWYTMQDPYYRDPTHLSEYVVPLIVKKLEGF